MTEIWKDISGHEGVYEISSEGRVKSLSRIIYSGKFTHKSKEKILKPGLGRYLQVTLCKNGSTKPFTVHRLVATAFLENPENKPQINHKNCIKTDNGVENLEWVTVQENFDHAKLNGLMPKGENQGGSKLTEKEVVAIRSFESYQITQKRMAKIYGVSITTISHIINRKTWNHIVLM